MKLVCLIIFLIFVLNIFIPSKVYTQLYNLKELMEYPILIEFSTGDSGSGMIITDSISTFLITAKHVLFQLVKNDNGYILSDTLRCDSGYVISYPRDYSITPPDTLFLNYKGLKSSDNIKCIEGRDVVVIKLGTQINKPFSGTEYNRYVRLHKLTKRNKWNLKQIIHYDNVMEGREIFTIGYPKSLKLKKNYLYDYSRPLLRNGCIAAKYDAEKTIVIDSPVFGGNSGGPVFMVSREGRNTIIKLIGIITESIQKENPKENSGYAIVEPVDKIIELVKEFYK